MIKRKKRNYYEKYIFSMGLTDHIPPSLSVFERLRGTVQLEWLQFYAWQDIGNSLNKKHILSQLDSSLITRPVFWPGFLCALFALVHRQRRAEINVSLSGYWHRTLDRWRSIKCMVCELYTDGGIYYFDTHQSDTISFGRYHRRANKSLRSGTDGGKVPLRSISYRLSRSNTQEFTALCSGGVDWILIFAAVMDTHRRDEVDEVGAYLKYVHLHSLQWKLIKKSHHLKLFKILKIQQLYF